jgi:hypothetical protein
VAFFEPLSPRSPRFNSQRRPLPWEEGLGRTVFSDVTLGHGPDGMLIMRNLIAFPHVTTLAVVALFRNALVDGRGTRGHNCPTFDPRFSAGESIGTGIVLIGLRFSDGTELRNLDERGSAGHLGGLGGRGGSFTGHYEFVAPMPPEGELELWAAWPAAQIPETRTVLDASLIREAAAGLHPPWSEKA